MSAKSLSPQRKSLSPNRNKNLKKTNYQFGVPKSHKITQKTSRTKSKKITKPQSKQQYQTSIAKKSNNDFSPFSQFLVLRNAKNASKLNQKLNYLKSRRSPKKPESKNFGLARSKSQKMKKQTLLQERVNKTRRRFRRKSPQPYLKRRYRLNQGKSDKENVKFYSPSPRMRKKCSPKRRKLHVFQTRKSPKRKQ